MGLTVVPPLNLDESRDPWRCDFCGFFVYSTKDGYPVKGAPIARYYSTAYPSVCAVCHALVNNPSLVTDYWHGLQREWEKAQKEKRDKYDGLSGRKDYLTGL